MWAMCRCFIRFKVVLSGFRWSKLNVSILLSLFILFTLFHYIFLRYTQTPTLHPRQPAEAQSTLRMNYDEPKSVAKHQSAESIQHLHPAVFVGKRHSDVTILIWTPLTKSKPLWGLTDFMVHSCPHQCKYTSDRSYIQQASLLLFRLRNLPSTGRKLRENLWQYNISALPTKKYPHQLWVDVNEESPIYTHADGELEAVDDKFDYLSSYHSNADLPLSYKTHDYMRRNVMELPINYAQNKTKMVLWFVSHCNAASGRDRYVKELQKYGVHVDIIGGCAKSYDGCQYSVDRKECIDRIRSQYKFYLAFENSICSEYITEKYWNTLNSNTYNIPIALGASLEEYEILSPPKSFLHVRNFSGPAHLAQFIKTIDNNDNMFNSYHAWRETLVPVSRPRERLHCWLCRIISEHPPNKHKHYSKFWTRDMCETNPEPINII